MSVVDYVAELERPLCSMSFNGIIFEDEIPGYRTIRVEGRDSFNHTIYEYSTRLNPGSRFQDWHEEPREITVTFALVSTTAQDLRKKLDKLKGLLRAPENKEAQIIFNDEPELYYVGSVSKFAEEKLVTIEHSAGQITIRCTDVRKFSVEEQTMTTDAEGLYQFTMDYLGTRPSYPKFKVNINSSTDYIGFVDQNEHMLQFGTPDDTEAAQTTPSTTALNQDFKTTYSGWVANAAHPKPAYADFTQHGSIGRNPSSNTSMGCYPSNYGTYNAETVTSWHGPSATHTVGTNGAKNWKLTCWFNQWQNTPQVDAVTVILKRDYDVFGCDGNTHYFDKNIDVPFAAYEGNKRIAASLSANVALLGVTSTNTAETTSSDGHVKWKIPKNTTISAASGSVTLTFNCAASTGNVVVTRTFNWVKETLPANNVNKVLFVNTGIPIEIKNNKTFISTTVTVGFGWWKGKTRVASTCTAPNIAGVKPKITNSTKSSNGSVQWIIPSGKANSQIPNEVTITFKVGSTTLTRTFGLNQRSYPAYRTDYSQRGHLDIIVAGTNHNNEMQCITDVDFYKIATGSNDGYFRINLDNKDVKTVTFKSEKSNKITGAPDGRSATFTIEKIGTKYTYTIGGQKYQFTNSNDLIATEVSFWFFKLQNTNVLERNSVRQIQFIKHADTVETYAAIPNKFHEGDEVIIDCETADITVNGEPEYGLGALGNDWDDFTLNPGTNEIQCVWDPDASTEPTFEMSYREVY